LITFRILEMVWPTLSREVIAAPVGGGAAVDMSAVSRVRYD